MPSEHHDRPDSLRQLRLEEMRRDAAQAPAWFTGRRAAAIDSLPIMILCARKGYPNPIARPRRRLRCIWGERRRVANFKCDDWARKRVKWIFLTLRALE